MAKNNIEDKVTALVQPIVEESERELVDVEYVKEGASWFLRIFIDKEEGIDLDDCQEISEQIGPLLDEKDPISQEYILEVSSPGINRPLKKEKDFERFKGRKVKVSTYAPVNGSKEIIGDLKGLVDEEVVLDVDGEEISIPRKDTSKIRLEVDF